LDQAPRLVHVIILQKKTSTGFTQVMPLDTARRCLVGSITILLIGNELMVTNAVRPDQDASLHDISVQGSGAMVSIKQSSSNTGTLRDGPYVCCCKPWIVEENPWYTHGSCARRHTEGRPGIIVNAKGKEEGHQMCCKDREKSCDAFLGIFKIYGYRYPLSEVTGGAETMPNCGGDVSDTQRLTLTRQVAAPDFQKLITMSRIKRIGSYSMFPQGVLTFSYWQETARSTPATVEDLMQAAEEAVAVAADTAQATASELVASGAGIVGYAMSGIFLANYEQQIQEKERLLAQALAPEQEALIRCEIRNHRKNEAVTTALFVVSVSTMAATMAAGPAGLAAAPFIAAGSLAVGLTNTAYNMILACSKEQIALKQWNEQQMKDLNEGLRARLAAVCEMEEEVAPADDLNPESKGKCREVPLQLE